MNGFGKEERERIMRDLRRVRAREAIFSDMSAQEVSDGDAEEEADPEEGTFEPDN